MLGTFDGAGADLDSRHFVEKRSKRKRKQPRSTVRVDQVLRLALVLRQHLLTAAGERRVIVGRDEVFEQLAVYQQGDDSGWARRLNSSWTKMLNSFSVLQQLEDDRAEVSPVLKVMIGPEEARAFTELYREIAAGQNDDDADVTTQEDDR